MATVLKGKYFSEGVNRGQTEIFNFEDVANRAREYLQTVREQADAILATARQESNDIRQSAMKTAIADGQVSLASSAQSMADNIANQRISAATQNIQTLGDQLEQATHQWLRQWQHETIPLAIAIAERLVRRQIDADPSILLQWLQDSVRLVQGSHQISLRIHPSDIEILGQSLESTLEQLRTQVAIILVPDESVQPRGLILQTSESTIDQQMQTQLDRLKEELQ